LPDSTDCQTESIYGNLIFSHYFFQEGGVALCIQGALQPSCVPSSLGLILVMCCWRRNDHVLSLSGKAETNKHRTWKRWGILEFLEKDGGLICIVLLLTEGTKFGQHLFYCITITGHHVI